MERRHIPNESGVYMIRNYQTKKNYIGYSKKMRRRITNHIAELNTHTHPNKCMLTDWEIDDTCWVCTVLELTTDKLSEEFWIDYYNSLNVEFGYNINKGSKLCERTKQIISDTRTGLKHTAETKLKMSQTLLKRNSDIKNKRKMLQRQISYHTSKVDYYQNKLNEFKTRLEELDNEYSSSS